MRSKAPASNMRYVDGSAGAWTDTTSAVASRWSNGTISTPGTGARAPPDHWRSRSCRAVGDDRDPRRDATDADQAEHAAELEGATDRSPFRPRRARRRDGAGVWSRRRSAPACARRWTPSARSACCTPRRLPPVASAMSTLSYPTPTREMTLAFGANANAAAFQGRTAPARIASAVSRLSSVREPTTIARPATRSS